MSKYYLLPHKTVCSELLKALFHLFAVNKFLCQYKGVHIDGMLSDMSDTSTHLVHCMSKESACWYSYLQC